MSELVRIGAACTLLPSSGTWAQAPEPAQRSARSAEIQELRGDLRRIAARLDALEREEDAEPGESTAENGLTAAPNPSSVVPLPPPDESGAVTSAAPAAAKPAPSLAAPVLTAGDAPTLTFFCGTTLNFGVDGYYDYNFNEPIGRVNLLRSYTVTSNSFILNQADIVVEHLPTVESRMGGRLDLQFGQATETLQGSSVNEQRPQVWRNIYQAYGSYLAPIGSGLEVDFGKWASSLGAEGNYEKDQIAYSRAFSYSYLPFYHMGFRLNYNVTPRLNVGYWLVNGASDTEDLNGFKSQAFYVHDQASQDACLECELLLRRRSA